LATAIARIRLVIFYRGTYKRSFCCFGSKLVKNIQVQARKQLGLGFGDVKSPECRGLTAEEIARVDFSKLDLSEIYEELIARYKAPNPVMIGDHFKNDMQHMQDQFKTNNSVSDIKEQVKQDGEALGITPKLKGKRL
jgi:hypothetical protein